MGISDYMAEGDDGVDHKPYSMSDAEWQHEEHDKPKASCRYCVTEFRAMLAAVAMSDRGFISEEVSSSD